MIKAKSWNGKDLQGNWLITYKIDGVRCLRQDGKVLSRAGKPLYNVDHVQLKDFEVYAGSWDSSVSLVRTSSYKYVPDEFIYSLDPLDPRLIYCAESYPTEIQIREYLEKSVAIGYEGLVLRQGTKWLRVKPVETVDLPVKGIILGKGKYKNCVGSFITELGNVGTGLTDAQRKEYVNLPVGSIIEVEYTSLTPQGMMREPRFIRHRFDKEGNNNE